jgi:hypothetical protein
LCCPIPSGLVPGPPCSSLDGALLAVLSPPPPPPPRRRITGSDERSPARLRWDMPDTELPGLARRPAAAAAGRCRKVLAPRLFPRQMQCNTDSPLWSRVEIRIKCSPGPAEVGAATLAGDADTCTRGGGLSGSTLRISIEVSSQCRCSSLRGNTASHASAASAINPDAGKIGSPRYLWSRAKPNASLERSTVQSLFSADRDIFPKMPCTAWSSVARTGLAVHANALGAPLKAGPGPSRGDCSDSSCCMPAARRWSATISGFPECPRGREGTATRCFGT